MLARRHFDVNLANVLGQQRFFVRLSKTSQNGVRVKAVYVYNSFDLLWSWIITLSFMQNAVSIKEK